jgi:hypothetical protein
VGLRILEVLFLPGIEPLVRGRSARSLVTISTTLSEVLQFIYLAENKLLPITKTDCVRKFQQSYVIFRRKNTEDLNVKNVGR